MSRVLLMVDVQKNMLEGEFPVPSAASVGPLLEGLVAAARAAEVPVVWVQNDGSDGDPDEPGTAGWELMFPALDGEIVVRKDVANTFESNPQLALLLKAGGVTEVVVAGMQSEYCVRATSSAALDLGFAVTLVAGGHATYDDAAPAAETSARIETELRAAGANVVPPAALGFSR